MLAQTSSNTFAIEFLSIRMLSILIVFIASTLLIQETMFVLFTSLLFCHYVLSFYYSKKQIKKIANTNSLLKKVLFYFLPLIAYFYFGLHELLLVPFIGLHISLSEVFIIDIKSNDQKKIQSLRIILSLLVFFIMTNFFSNRQILNVIFGISFPVVLAIFYYLFKQKSNWRKSEFVCLSLFLSLEFSLSTFCYFYQKSISPSMFVYYHIVTWLFIPIFKAPAEKRGRFSSLFAIQNIALVVLFFFIQTKGATLGNGAYWFKTYIPLWANIHFASTIPLSRLNPNFIRKFFELT